MSGDGKFGFLSLVGELVSQLLGAFLGNMVLTKMNDAWTLTSVGTKGVALYAADGSIDANVTLNFFKEFAAVAVFLYILNKKAKVGLPDWMFTIAAFYIAFTMGSPVIIGSRMFADMCSFTTFFTYILHLGTAVVVASVDYFFE